MNKLLIILTTILALNISLTAKINKSACTSCHGNNFEKSALGKSAIIANLSHKTISIALKGYKNGTYGGDLKGLMSKVGAYSDEEIDTFSKTIGKKD